MTADEKTLTQFTTRIRQMILQYKEIKQENDALYELVDECEGKIKQLECQLTQARNDYNALKMAKMIEITDADMESARKRLCKLIRDVDKCITLLNDK